MMFGLFRRSANEAMIDRLYMAIVAAARAKPLFIDYGIPDTFEGRFESLALHAVLVLRRLKDLERPGPDMAQHLTDTIFRHFDRTFREMGVGDTTVPKRMKGIAEAFLGRGIAYDAALKAGLEPLTAALVRNVFAGRGDGAVLASYVLASERILARIPLQGFIDGDLAFADPRLVTAP